MPGPTAYGWPGHRFLMVEKLFFRFRGRTSDKRVLSENTSCSILQM